jgi:hypothetical protein
MYIGVRLCHPTLVIAMICWNIATATPANKLANDRRNRRAVAGGHERASRSPSLGSATSGDRWKCLRVIC